MNVDWKRFVQFEESPLQKSALFHIWSKKREERRGNERQRERRGKRRERGYRKFLEKGDTE